ncbi:MAG: peptidase, partial [Bacteroidetes bacterium]
YDFVLYEYYFTDDAGHSQSMEKAIVTLQNVDRLLEGIVEHFNFKKNLFLLTSDHGNIEDVSTKSHTRNPVPLLAMGIGHEAVARKVKRLVDVAPAVVRLIGDN